MTKKKKIVISVIAAVFAVIIGLGASFCISVYVDYGSINYKINDTLPDGQGKTVRVVLLGGQSNASGCSRDEYLKKNVSPEKHAEYQSGYDNVYINYFASGNNISEGFVKCATLQGESGGFFGPELGLAEKLSEMYPNETIFIIKWAFGATDLFSQWLSPSSLGKTGELYKHFVRFTQLSLEYLVSKNYDVKIEGMCWMQGESDSFSTENATNYEIHLKNFINDIRFAFRHYASDDGIAFVDAYIADNPVYWVYCDLVNESKRKVAELSPINTVINTDELTCAEEPEDAPDLAHYDSMSEIRLGHIFADEVSKFFD